MKNCETNNQSSEYRLFAYLFFFAHLIINQTLNQICTILNVYLDTELQFPIGTNAKTIAVSSFLAAIGKFFGIFISGSKKKIIIWSFFGIGFSLLVCITTKSYIIFFLARISQGFLSGVQNSLLFGFLGTLKDCRSGFCNYTGVIGVIYCLNGIIFYFFEPIQLLLVMSILSFFSGFLFLNIGGFKDSKFSIQQIDWFTIKNLVKKKNFVIKTVFLGCFLSFCLIAIGQQKNIIKNVFNIRFEKLSNVLPSLSFLSQSMVSFFPIFHSFNMFNILNFICLWCIFLGLMAKNIYIFLVGLFVPMCCFSIINPIILEELTLMSSNRFISSAFAGCLRSIVSSVVLLVFPLCFSSSLLEISVISLFVSGFLYTIFLHR